MSVAKTARKGVTYHNPRKTAEGYTLFSTYNRDVWLIDMEGYIVNRWQMPYTPGAHQLLMPGGTLLFAGMLKSHEELGLPVEMAAIGGILIEVNWDSELVWKASVPYQNHDIRPLRNGNVLYHSYHPDGILSAETADRMKGGRAGTEFEGQMWGDMIHEVDRQGKIVWDWKASEHLDPELDRSCALENRTLWPYINSLFECADGTVLVTLRAASEVVRIDRRTGDVTARYGKGCITHPHDARELENGNILLFDNGSHRKEYKPSYSRVVEIDPVRDEVVWQYKAPFASDFYSPVCGGCERQSNGNTVICDSWSGRVFEVTLEGELVWEYMSPFVGSIVGMDTTMIWRAHRYEPDYPGLQDKQLDRRRFPKENLLFGPAAASSHKLPLMA
ncbi:MAG: aryl-sulfate sulfotransferase [Spirochaetales bacterium]|nr:aryl-sulfate sulfotransferase [Spirochaetales bacterium]